MIVTVPYLKENLNQTLDLDDALIERKIVAAQDHVERLLGFKIEVEYPPTDADPPVSTVPPALVECVSQLASHWYENREATLVSVAAQEIPFGVAQIVQEYRNWSWCDE
ncbi:MAG: phage gp6-like head-tail connector protein [Pseudaminobacter sp.]|nr:phage gp6-like head-tail connector protein [Pseudaminobacter sp.]